MRTVFEPSRAAGIVMAPPSKSLSHRAVLSALLSHGTSRIENTVLSDDLEAMFEAAAVLGAETGKEGKTLTLTGIGGHLPEGDLVLNARESGSMMRFLIPLMWLRNGRTEILGTPRLLRRPQTVYEDIAKDQGLKLEIKQDRIVLEGRLKPGIFNVRGDISSQFITGLLFALPLLDQDSTIRFTTRVESFPYMELTRWFLKDFGVTSSMVPAGLYVPGNQHFRASDALIEGDWSQAAYLESFNVIGGDVSVEGLSDYSYQGDRIFRTLFKQLENKHPEIDLTDTPDLGPVLFAAAAVLNGSHFTGTHRLVYKESNRMNAMKEELAKFGVVMEVTEDDVTVFPAVVHTPAVPVNSHSDHRVAMALSLILSVTGGIMEEAETVKKSFPDFFDVIQSLGIKVSMEE